jgi:hypothetical protein
MTSRYRICEPEEARLSKGEQVIMLRLKTKLFVGMILAVVLVMGVFAVTPAKGQSGASSLGDMLSKIIGVYHESLVSPLYEAGTEVQDSEIDQMYQKLLREYELSETSPEVIGGVEDFNLADVLPDIKKINQVAITLPLEEAGKNIQDEEIAQFYYEFLESTGLVVESN